MSKQPGKTVAYQSASTMKLRLKLFFWHGDKYFIRSFWTIGRRRVRHKAIAGCLRDSGQMCTGSSVYNQKRTSQANALAASLIVVHKHQARQLCWVPSHDPSQAHLCSTRQARCLLITQQAGSYHSAEDACWHPPQSDMPRPRRPPQGLLGISLQRLQHTKNE